MASVEDLDWDALHRALWVAVSRHTSTVAETTAEYGSLIREAVREGMGTLTPQAEQWISDYLDAADGLIRDGIEQAVTPIAEAATVGAAEAVREAMRDEFVAAEVGKAYSRRWEDGLHLSDRVWAWSGATRRGVGDVLEAGVRTGRTVDALVMEMQRAIESTEGERFSLVTTMREDWADRLRAAGRASIRDPGGVDRWAKAVGEARAHVEGLKVGGTRRQAESALSGILDAVTKGRQDLVDRHLSWWLYDRQLYALKRVVRTEMATAHHRAVLAIGEEDPDVTGYRWRLSASHPEPDICDYYADIELGLGRGVWPKEQAPQGKAHPHCMCSLTPTTRRQRRDGEQGSVNLPTFLDGLSRRKLEEIAPRWAIDAHDQGTPWADMLRPDGRWFANASSVDDATP